MLQLAKFDAKSTMPVLGNARGGSFLKFILCLVIVALLGGMVAFVYFTGHSQDLSGINGREAVIKAREENRDIMSTDVLEKIGNGYDGNFEVKITEEELNRYIAKKLKMKQGGWMKGFATIKGVYVKLKKDEMEVFIEREVAQYGEDGTPNTDLFKPFDQTVSMRLNITTVDVKDGGTSKTVEFPGGTIGQAPAPGMFVKLIKASYDQIQEHFAKEIELGYKNITRITVEDGYILLDPRKNRRTEQAPLR